MLKIFKLFRRIILSAPNFLNNKNFIANNNIDFLFVFLIVFVACMNKIDFQYLVSHVSVQYFDF